MEKLLSLTIINDKNLRGVLAPAKLLSQELLGDILDLISYSHAGVAAAINRDFKKTKKERLIDGEALKKSLKL